MSSLTLLIVNEGGDYRGSHVNTFNKKFDVPLNDPNFLQDAMKKIAFMDIPLEIKASLSRKLIASNITRDRELTSFGFTYKNMLTSYIIARFRDASEIQTRDKAIDEFCTLMAIENVCYYIVNRKLSRVLIAPERRMRKIISSMIISQKVDLLNHEYSENIDHGTIREFILGQKLRDIGKFIPDYKY